MRTELVAAAVILVFLAVLAEVVLSDATRHDNEGEPVVMRFGPYLIERPQTWAALCLFGSVFFVPAYLLARQHREDQ